MKYLDKMGEIIGVRPDIAVIFLILFILALFLLVLLAKKNFLFYFSQNKPTKKVRNGELYE